MTFESYLHDLALSPITIKSYVADIKRFSQYLGRDPETAKPSDLVRYKNILSRHYQAATVNRHLSSIARFLKFARSEGMTETRLPEKLWQRPRRVTAPKSLDQAQQRALIRATNEVGNPRDIALIGVLLNCGLRSAEAADLKLSDVTHKAVHVAAGKGNVSRDIPLNAPTYVVVRQYLDWRNGDPTPHFFIGERGPLTTRGIAYVVRKYAYLGQIGPIGPHVLRHTFAANLVRAGTPLDRVGLLLGHVSLDTTRIYTYPSGDDLAAEVEKLGVQR